MHVIIRLSDTPLTLFNDATHGATQTFGPSVVGGARSAFYDKLAGEAACSVGAQLEPGGALMLLGASAAQLAERHTSLDAVWGQDAALWRERLYHASACRGLNAQPECAAALARRRIDVWESLLLARLKRSDEYLRQLRWLSGTVRGIEANLPLAAVVDACGVSHRTFITRFRELVGVSPKVYARVQRFQRFVAASHREFGQGRAVTLAQLAFDAGYADQAHLSRDFSEFAGFSPRTYVRSLPVAPNHVHIAP